MSRSMCRQDGRALGVAKGASTDDVNEGVTTWWRPAEPCTCRPFGTVDDEEGDMRRRGARECDEALMEATEARRGYARVAAWDEGNLIQAMARLKNPTIAWRYGDG